jgi:hypothetical protein
MRARLDEGSLLQRRRSIRPGGPFVWAQIRATPPTGEPGIDSARRTLCSV